MSPKKKKKFAGRKAKDDPPPPPTRTPPGPVQFPGLINGCTIDWFLPWPQDALTEVSSHALSTCGDLAALPVPQRTALQRLMAAVHQRVAAACQQYFLQYRRQAHVTPKSFIAALEGFKQLYRCEGGRVVASGV